MRVDFKTGTFYLGDCFDVMAGLPAGSVDMVLNDPPYGTTACAWDSVLPLDRMWEEYWRVVKANAAVVMTASQPFTTTLIASQMMRFKYCWVWDKIKPSTGLHAKYMPLRVTEDIVVFAKSKVFYCPQMTPAPRRQENKNDRNGEAFGNGRVQRTHDNLGLSYPKNLISLSNADQTNRVHPTQKPVALFEYLIRTYTNPGELVLDNTAGSGTTAVAALQAGRRWVCIERDPEYFAKAIARVYDAEAAMA